LFASGLWILEMKIVKICWNLSKFVLSKKRMYMSVIFIEEWVKAACDNITTGGVISLGNKFRHVPTPLFFSLFFCLFHAEEQELLHIYPSSVSLPLALGKWTVLFRELVGPSPSIHPLLSLSFTIDAIPPRNDAFSEYTWLEYV